MINRKWYLFGSKVLRAWSAEVVQDHYPFLQIEELEYLCEVEHEKQILYTWESTTGIEFTKEKFNSWPPEVREMILSKKPCWVCGESEPKEAPEKKCGCEIRTLMMMGCQCGGV